MRSIMAALRSLVLPYGATSGTRIILDGVNGRISLYDATDTEVIREDSATQLLTVGAMAGDRAVLDGTDGSFSVIDTAGYSIVCDPSSAGYPTIYFNRGSNFGWINSPTAGEIEVSAEKSGSPRTRLRCSPSNAVMNYLDGSNVSQGGSLGLNSTDAYLGKSSAGSLTSYFSATANYAYMEAATAVRSVTTYNNTTASSANVYINSNGTMYRSTSARKYKTDITPAVIDPDDVLALKPMTFFDKKQLEEWSAPRPARPRDDDSFLPETRDIAPHRLVGLIAEDVAEIPGLAEVLVEKDADGNPDSVNYDRLPVLLLEVVKKQEARINALEAML